jgi:UDP-N-acetylmuramoylalanine--D-glutamate ligase
VKLATLAGGDLRAALPGARVVVVGLGKSGVAAAALCRGLGAEVVGTDAAGPDRLADAVASLTAAGVELALGGHAAAGLERADLIVISPGVPSFPELAGAEGRGVPVIGEIELATRLLPGVPVIAITGSNGKSTTTTLVGELLAGAGIRAFVGGNLGDPPAAIVPRPGGPTAIEHEVLVLEISSFQAERVPLLRPRAAALLNLSPNHLDRYDSYQAYADAKGNLFVRQQGDDLAVIPAGDEPCEAQARRGSGRVVRFGPLADGADVGFDRDRIEDRRSGFAIARRAIALAGDHNALNVCAALALTSPWVADHAVLTEVLSRFRGLPHRVALVAEVDGRTFYDDSKGTSVGAAVAAIRGLPEDRVVLIAGGRDKMGSYQPLVDAMRARGRAAILIGEAADRIAEALGDAVPIERAGSMEEAVAAAAARAQPGDAVLLSPACSSFDMFRDYKHRGDAFVDAVTAISRAR